MVTELWIDASARHVTDAHIRFLCLHDGLSHEFVKKYDKFVEKQFTLLQRVESVIAVAYVAVCYYIAFNFSLLCDYCMVFF